MKADTKILFVDDDESVLSLITTIFSRPNYHLRLARNGKEALRLFAAERPPLVITDIRMPEFDPFFTTRERGTGLGLSVSCRSVQAHGGRMTVESQEGKGERTKVRRRGDAQSPGRG